MGLAIAVFHWAPDTFTHSTPHEFWAAYEVYLKMNQRPDEPGVK